MRRWLLGGLLLFVGISMGLGLGWMLSEGSALRLSVSPTPQPLLPTPTRPSVPPTPTETATVLPTPTLVSTLTVERRPALATPFTWTTFAEQGLVLAALQEGIRPALYAYHPQKLPWVRLLDQAVETPALSPSGRWVALSLYNGRWQLALLDMAQGTWQELPSFADYAAWPAWSPDEQWLVYAAYRDGDMNLWIRPAWDPQGAPIPLTESEGVDSSPAWSPQGRVVAFVSLRSGTPQIFLVNLDDPEKVRQVSREDAGLAFSPAWSPDGRYLVWCQEKEGLHRLWVWDVTQPEASPVPYGEGCWPRWRGDGKGIWAVILRPEGSYLTQYAFPEVDLVLPLVAVPGEMKGWTVGYSALAHPLPEPMARAAQRTPPPLWAPSEEGSSPSAVLVPIDDVDVPYPYLSDAVDEAYAVLREQARRYLGWDPLGQVKSLYLPPTLGDPLGQENWLSTGRAFALPEVWLDEGRMVVVREAYPQGTYWRVFLKPEAQDGSQGHPLTTTVWDFVRGEEVPPPSGFWVDFTALAQAVGWERLPALPYWRTYFPATRFHLFVYRGNRTWAEAFAELHPQGTPPAFPVTPTPGGAP